MTEFMIGKREQHAICEEDAWASLGTKTMADDGFIIGKNVKCTPAFSTGWQEVLGAGADSRDIDSLEKGSLGYNFQLEFGVTNWKFLRYGAHGGVTNTGTSPTVHTFSTTDEVKSFTYEWAKRGSPNHVTTLTGCIIKKWTLSYSKSAGAAEGFVKVVADCLAKSKSTGSSITTIPTNTDDAFQFRMAELTYASGEVVEVNSGELTCDNGINEQDSRYCNPTLDQLIGEPIPLVIRYTSRFNINQKDATYSDDFDDQVVVSGTNSLKLIRGTSPADDVTFTFTDLYLRTPGESPTNMEGVTNIDVVGTIKSMVIVANDALTDY